jgi:Fe-S oxidoreductase
MFKEAEKGNKEVNIERTEEALSAGQAGMQTPPDIIATGCPFCMTMMTDGVKHFNKEAEVKVMDVAELVADGVVRK